MYLVRSGCNGSMVDQNASTDTLLIQNADEPVSDET